MANKYNAERYPDPTAHAAISQVEKGEAYRPLVYICSPYAGNIERNTEKARKYSRFAVEQGAIPLAPHLLFPQFMDDKNPKERHLVCHKFNYVLLGKCAELWVFGDVISKGMAYEIETARKRKQKIRYFTDGCEEVSQ